MVISGPFGAAVPVAVLRLQNALIALGRKTRDSSLMVTPDGVVGPKTVAATNRALSVYVVRGSGLVPPTWKNATSSVIKASANDIAPYIERAAGIQPPVLNTERAAAMQAGMAAIAASAATSANPGGPNMQQYPPPQQYYPPQPGYAPRPAYGPQYPQGYAPRGPGGLPTDQASLDVKAFIPAQYEHIRLHPGVGMFLVATGMVVIFLLIKDKRKNAKA